MKNGISGSGLMGGKQASCSPGPATTLSQLRAQRPEAEAACREAEGTARARTPAESVSDADAVLLAVHWLRRDDVLKQAGDLSRKVVVKLERRRHLSRHRAHVVKH